MQVTHEKYGVCVGVCVGVGDAPKDNVAVCEPDGVGVFDGDARVTTVDEHMPFDKHVAGGSGGTDCPSDVHDALLIDADVSWQFDEQHVVPQYVIGAIGTKVAVDHCVPLAAPNHTAENPYCESPIVLIGDNGDCVKSKNVAHDTDVSDV